MNKKRGQVTLFVILGLVIVIAISLAIYFTNNSRGSAFTKPNIDVDEKYAPVQDYVQQCMNQLLLDGITKLGQHGGYIDPRDLELTGKSFNLNVISQDDSDAAFLSSNLPDSAVLYWVHGSSSQECENCIVSTNTPSIIHMEYQLSRYIEKNMAFCLNNYNVFNSMGYLVIDSKNYTVRTSITDSGVAALLETNVYIKISEDEGKLEEFYTETDLPLKKYYDMASIIAVREIETNYLENVALYLLNTHTGLDAKKLPPISEIQEGYNVVYWSKTAVREKFEGLLTSYVGVLRVPNTRNYVDIDYTRLSPSEKYYYNATSLDIFEGADLKTSEISFIYAGQDIYMDINPSDGELIKPITYEPQEFSFMFKSRIINSYNFYYEISYPVIVEIRDEYKPGSTYSFLFAMEGIIVDNLRIRDYYNDSLNQIYWDENFVQTTYNTPEATVDVSQYNLGNQFNAEISQAAASQTFSNSGLKSVKTQFCNENQRTSGDVAFRTYDSVTNEPLADVSITFTCGSFVQCNMGRSEFNLTYGESSFKEKFPICKNGYIQLSKQGYLPKNILLSTDTKNNQNFGAIYLDPLIKKEFRVKKYEVTKTVVGPSDTKVLVVPQESVNLTENESVIISIEKITYEASDEPYATTAIISKEFGNSASTLTLTPGTYSLRIQLLDGEGVIIPKECKRICVEGPSAVGSVLGDDCGEYDYIPKDNIEIKPAPWGGIDYTNRTFMYISPAQLADPSNILELRVIKLPNPECLDDMKDISEIEPLSKKYSATLLPQFVVK
ncbi:MAG TPA: hypothetical protein VEC16_00595 [Alphaproteobacteria bacterium]|nr:hypothetical protein [Alphaproteobacteria bacterium]